MPMRTIALVILLLAPAGALAAQSARPAPADEVGRVAFIAGCWQQDRGTRTTQEQWTAPSGGLMLGTSRTVVGNVAREFEFLRIAMYEGKLAYIAQPGGGPATVFPVSVLGDSSVTFENLTHDFPQRIIYRRIGADSLMARIEGPGPNGVRGIDYPMKRVDCGK